MSSPPGSDKQLERALARDPVWKGIVARREKRGANRPASEEERAALGTRAELQKVDPYGDEFWKVLEKARPEEVYGWERDRSGGRVPPFFNLGRMQVLRRRRRLREAQLTITPGMERSSSAPTGPAMTASSASTRPRTGRQVEAELKVTDGQDAETIKVTMGRLALLTRKDLQTLVSSLIAAQLELELHHPMGVPHKKWSY